MKILLLSLLAITMIGLTVPNAFADHIKNEIPIDVFKLTEDQLNEMPRIWYNPNTSSWEENIWTDTKYELKTESKVPTSIAGAESRLMQTFSGITIQDRILEFKIRYTEFNSQNSAIEYFDLILLDGGPAIALNKDWELVHLPKGSGSDCKSVDYPQGQKFGPKGVCHIGNYVMEFSMSMKGDVVEPVSETNFIIAMLLEDRYSLMTKSVILEKEQMTMEPESQFSLQQQKNDQELDRTETGNGITIDVYQEKSSYEFGDPILLKFQVSKFIPNTPLEFQIFRDGVQPQHGLGGCGAVKTNSMSLDNNGIAYYRFDTFDSQGLNKAANAYACKIEDHGPATYFVNVYYGAQWNFSGGKPNIGIPTDYLASAKTSFTFSNEYSRYSIS